MEVKQRIPNPEERKQQADFDTGKMVAFGGTPGVRICRAIDDGYPQLRRMTGRWRPGVLVIYDNVHLPTIHVDAYAVKTGMHGLEQCHPSSVTRFHPLKNRRHRSRPKAESRARPEHGS